MIMTRKKWLSIIGSVIILALVVFGLRAAFSPSENNRYLTATTKKGDIEVSVLATGIVKPHRLVAVGARATGRVIALKVKPGSVVKEGDLLAEIDPTTQQNDLKSRQAALDDYKAKLAEQQAQLALAKQNFYRQRTMIKSNATSKADFDEAEAQVEIRQAQIKALSAEIIQAEVDVETAKVNLGYTRVTAPSDGTVLATVVQEGQNVNAVQSAPTIVILGDLSVMTVRAEISEADIVNVKPGQELYFNVIGNPNRRYQARLDEIEPAPESIRNDISFNSTVGSTNSSSAIYYNGTFNIDNSDGALRTYMTAEVHIVLGKAQGVLLIPADALTNVNGNKASVFVLKGQELVERSVEVGLNNKVMVEIQSGLKEGDVVVTNATDGSLIAAAKHHRVGLW